MQLWVLGLRLASPAIWNRRNKFREEMRLLDPEQSVCVDLYYWRSWWQAILQRCLGSWCHKPFVESAWGMRAATPGKVFSYCSSHEYWHCNLWRVSLQGQFFVCSRFDIIKTQKLYLANNFVYLGKFTDVAKMSVPWMSFSFCNLALSIQMAVTTFQCARFLATIGAKRRGNSSDQKL